MHQLIKDFFAWLESAGVALPEVYVPYITAGLAFAGSMVVITFAALYAGAFIFLERRIGARMMSRVGPNRVGPHGLLQFLADGVKFIMKEDIIPGAADRPLFKLAPYLMVAGVLSAFAALPFSQKLIAADLNIGLLYILAVTSIGVVGILMSGWASNSKWALFGGMRSAAQIVSYEIPTGLALLPAVLLSGTMSTQGIIHAQGGAPWNWYIFHSPWLFALFFIYFVSALAEGSRTPFDLPEAESELVSGYNTEYSGFRFLSYFLAEFANTWVAAAVATIVFLGGWQIPGVSPEYYADKGGLAGVGWQLLSLGIFFLKTGTLVFLIIQLRWTLPRVRVDQMMTLCWKYLVPITFALTMIVMVHMFVAPWDSTQGLVIRVIMFGVGTAALVKYIARIRYNIRSAREKAYWHWAL